MNVQLSLEETYADITPVRTSANNVSAYLYDPPLPANKH